MSIEKEAGSLSIGGKEAVVFRLSNENHTAVRISNYGCLILSWITRDARGNPQDIVLGFDRLEDYLQKSYLENYPYFGVIVGRYANRIKDARFRLNGTLYELPANKGKDHIHGGFCGFDRAVWSVEEVDGEANRLCLAYTSPGGEEGYPGNLKLRISYTLTDDDRLIQEITAQTDEATPVNLTHHDYFNLHGGSGRIDEHRLQIRADAWLEQDDNMVVTGNLIPVENSYHDFRQPKKVGRDLKEADEYDQSFVLNKKAGELSLAACLESEQNGLRLQVYTTEPVCHLYTGKWIPELKGKKGQPYGPFSGLCLEVQHHPNALNIPSFPDTILYPGEDYHQQTIYQVSVADELLR